MPKLRPRKGLRGIKRPIRQKESRWEYIEFLALAVASETPPPRSGGGGLPFGYVSLSRSYCAFPALFGDACGAYGMLALGLRCLMAW